MKKIKFRGGVKSEIRILGVDDGAFTPHSSEKVYIIGAVFRGGQWLEGVLGTIIQVDGLDATEKIAEMITRSPHYGQLRVIMLNGITFAGFNVVDIQILHEITSLPVLAITRNKPCTEDVENALKKMPNYEERMKAVKNAGEMMSLETKKGATLYIHRAGISKEDTEKVVSVSCSRSSIPEALRIAHMIASSLYKVGRLLNKKV